MNSDTLRAFAKRLQQKLAAFLKSSTFDQIDVEVQSPANIRIFVTLIFAESVQNRRAVNEKIGTWLSNQRLNFNEEMVEGDTLGFSTSCTEDVVKDILGIGEL